MNFFIQDYQESWAKQFLARKEIIQQASGPFATSIDHIGSTSVAGLGAKPIIDILVGIEHASSLDKIVPPMQKAGFTYFKKYEPSWPERRFFVELAPVSAQQLPLIIDIDDDDSFRQFFTSKTHIHFLVKDTHDWKRHIAFRDFLRTHPDARDAYYQLKKKLSEREFKDMLEYNAHKNDFVKTMERKAMVWYDRSQRGATPGNSK